MSSPPSAENDVLEEVERRIEAARAEAWQQHLRDHPLSDATSCPRDYGVHDAYAHAVFIVREVARERRPIPPGGTT